MTWMFWTAFAVVVYAYAGYAGWLWIRGKWRPWPVLRGMTAPAVSIVMVVRNEAGALRGKLRNLLALKYPGNVQIVIVSDGSTDGTEEILREAAGDSRVQVMLNQLARGKAAGLNDGVGQAAGEVVVFTDARQIIEEDALRLLMENFADPLVGAASGELMLGNRREETSRGMGLYWRIEKRVRELESASGSVVGATGALYAARRELVTELPEGTILDDVWIPIHVARQGSRVVFDARARAWDQADLGAGREFQRKVRTLTGNYQLLQLAPWLMGGENPLRFELVSHKLMRLIVPFALVALLVASGIAPGNFYRVAFWLQVCGYVLGLIGLMRWNVGPLARLTDAAGTFVALNAAAVVAFAKFVTGQKAEWTPAAPSVRKEMRA